MGVLLDILVFPVSAVLWCWRTVFGGLFGQDSTVAWVLAIVFVVFTLRMLTFRSALTEWRGRRRMLAVQPQLFEIIETYRDDPARASAERKKLYAAQGVRQRPGFWPGLLRAVVFVSFLFVLWNFTSDVRPNPVLDQAARDSFLRTDLFGAGLDNWISQFGTDRMDVLAVGGLLLLASVVATFVPAWISVRQAAAPDTDRNSAIVNTVGLTLMPVCQLVPGLFLPVPLGVLLYMLVSNVWWFAESVLVRRKVDRELVRR